MKVQGQEIEFFLLCFKLYVLLFFFSTYVVFSSCLISRYGIKISAGCEEFLFLLPLLKTQSWNIFFFDHASRFLLPSRKSLEQYIEQWWIEILFLEEWKLESSLYDSPAEICWRTKLPTELRIICDVATHSHSNHDIPPIRETINSFSMKIQLNSFRVHGVRTILLAQCWVN